MSVNSSYRASNVFVEMNGIKDSTGASYLTPTGLIVGQYDSTATGITDYEITQLTTADEVAAKYGFGSELHRQAIWVFGILGGTSANMYFCPVVAPTSGVAATGDITFTTDSTSAGTYYFSIGGDVIDVTVPKGSTASEAGDLLVSAITAETNALVSAVNTAGTVAITAKNTGTNGNYIRMDLNPSGATQESENPTGMTVSVDALLTGGAGAVDIHDVFFNSSEEDILGDRYYTFISCPYFDSTNLGYVNDSWVIRSGAGVKRPFATVVGYTTQTYTEALAVAPTINRKCIAPVWDNRSYAQPCELSAAVMGVAMASCSVDPGRPFKTVETGIPFDTSIADLSYVKNDALFRSGMGYFKGTSGNLLTGDLALSYRTNTAGADTEEWYDLVALTLRQQKVYELDTLFNSTPYTRGILASNDSTSTKSYVIKPKKVIADLSTLIDNWNDEGWTKNADTVKATLSASINSSNNSRVDASFTDDEAKALRIVNIAYNFLF